MSMISDTATATKGFFSNLNWKQGLGGVMLASAAFGLGWTIASRRDRKVIEQLKAGTAPAKATDAPVETAKAA